MTDDASPPIPRPRTSPAVARAALFVLAWAAIVAAAWWGGRRGWRERLATWDQCRQVRAVWDMDNGWNWGRRAAVEGYVNLYDRVGAEHPDHQYGLDYVPLRLGVMTGWAAWNRAHGKDPGGWRAETDFNRPWMWFNYGSDALASAAAAGLVWAVCRRAGWGRTRAAGYAWVAAAFVWLNPAVMISGFGRPTWDVWMLPWFLLAAWASVCRHWTTAGAMLAIGVMFKGQQTGAIPFFIPFALVAGGAPALLRFVGGFGAMAAAVLSPWIFTLVPEGNDSRPLNVEALVAAAIAVAAMVALALAWWGVRMQWAQRRSRARADHRLRARRFPVRGIVTAVLLGVTLGAVWPVVRGQASTAWWDVAFVYGANKFPALESGGTASLGGLLQNSFRWGPDDLVFGHVTIKQLMVWLYGAAAISVGVMAGLQWRRRDVRVLVAFPAVWVCFFALMPLMHERYLLWGAAYCGVALPVTWGTLPVGALLSTFSYLMTLRVMIGGPFPADKFKALGYEAPRWSAWAHSILPGGAWGVLVAAGVLWWLSVSTRGRPRHLARR